MGDQFSIADFICKKDDLTNKIESLSLGSDVHEQLSRLTKEIQKLSKSLHDSIAFLPSYSIKKRQEEIRHLEKLLKDKENILVPKRKFGFKSKMRNVIQEDKLPEDNSHEVGKKENNNSSETLVKADSNFVTIEDVADRIVIYEEKELNGSDVLVRNLHDLTIQLRGTPSTLRISGLNNCTLVCGPVYTSIFVENCINCKLYLCCQQLRTHSSREVDIYLWVRARAIIEDCNGIRFAPYNYSHNKLSEWHQRVDVDSTLHRFEVVDDFNWLSNSPSPNWTVLPEDEREDFRV